MKKVIYILLLTIVLATGAAAQDDKYIVDSLRNEFFAASDDKKKAFVCMEISDAAYEPDTVIKYSQIALDLAQELGFDVMSQLSEGNGLDLMAQCYSNIGWGYYIKRDFERSVEKYKRAAELFDRLSKPEEAALVFINVAACYRYTNKFKQMWENLYAGLNKAREACDTITICYACLELGDVYQSQKMGSIAQGLLLDAFNLARLSGNYAEMGAIAKQLGSIVSEDDIEHVKASKGWALEAESYFSQAEPLDPYYRSMRNNNYAQLIFCYLSLAKFYYDDRYIDSTKHLVELFDDYAYNVSTVVDDKITSMHIHARMMMHEQQYKKAVSILKHCVEVAAQEQNHYLSDITYALLADSYEHVGDFGNALFYLNKYCESKQPLSGTDATMQTIAYKARYEIENERRDLELKKRQAENEEKEREDHNRRTDAAIMAISVAVMLIIVIMLIFWLLAKRAVKNIAKRNVQIMKQQLMIDDQKKALQETSGKIHESMLYARRIQAATTSDEPELTAIFPESLVVYKPQEIVSGDWYWVCQEDRQRIVAVGGSSEHGAPGAMACMLVVDALKETIHQIVPDANFSPSEVLIQVENKVRKSLGSDVEIAITLCVIDPNNQFKLAAINNDAVLVHDGDASKIIINKREDVVSSLNSGDYLFLYSNNTRRLMSSTVSNPESLCQTLAATPADAQQLAVSAIAGGQNQSGDITIVGIRG